MVVDPGDWGHLVDRAEHRWRSFDVLAKWLGSGWVPAWFIAPVTFVISLFTDNINLYEVHNNGNWYDFGFVLGADILFGGGGAGARRKGR